MRATATVTHSSFSALRTFRNQSPAHQTLLHLTVALARISHSSWNRKTPLFRSTHVVLQTEDQLRVSLLL